MNEVCQSGIDDVKIPSWCVEYSLSSSVILQGILELIVLICYLYCVGNSSNIGKRRIKLNIPHLFGNRKVEIGIRNNIYY